MQRIGVFGGTFDPIHLGHLIIAEQCRHSLHLDAVWFVPAGDPPHKPDQALSPAAERVTMLELALAGRECFAIDFVDLERAGPSYTVDTLARLRLAHPDSEFAFIMGADSLMELHTWREPERIVALSEIAVARRPNVAIDETLAISRVPGLRGRLHIVDVPLIGISSRDLRRRVAAGEPIAFQVPDEVERHIRRQGLYRSE